MRKIFVGAVVFLAACANAAPAPEAPAKLPATSSSSAAPPATKSEKLAADTPKTTTEGATFIAPADWTLGVRGPVTTLVAPEGDSRIALVDVHAGDADSAVAAAWAAYATEKKWPLKIATDSPDKDGWSKQRRYEYQTSPNEKRAVQVDAMQANGTWTVIIYDVSEATSEKRLGAIALVASKLLPKGYSRETFAGKKANKLDAARIDALKAWTQLAMKELKVPGVAVGIVQDGKVVFADGFGAKELGKPAKPDADTLFMIASNTKALTTLMLAKLVEEKKFSWQTPVTEVMPTFELGDAATTKQVLVKHLICACTGLPRQDSEWLFQFKGLTPAGAMKTLATMQPTSKFGAMFQYSNVLAGAAGYVGAYAVNPKSELGAGYDEAMRSRVFEPLGMRATTFDYARALAGNHAMPHSPDIDGKPSKALMEVNYSVIPVRPAGAAWSNVHDLLSYVTMELAEGTLPNGKRYIDKGILLERRVPQVPIGNDETYGMGLEVNTKYGTPVVHHGGSLFGFYSDMMWLPEHNVGAVVLTNGEPGWALRNIFRRKLLEVLFDGRSEADADVVASAKTFYDQVAAERKLLTVPADAAASSALARSYRNAALGDILVSQTGGATTFDIGEWKSPVGSRKNPDGTTSFVTTAPGVIGIEFVVGSSEKRTLVLRDAQHEYVFVEQ